MTFVVVLTFCVVHAQNIAAMVAGLCSSNAWTRFTSRHCENQFIQNVELNVIGLKDTLCNYDVGHIL